MRSTVFILFTIGILFGINSCCTKKDCVGDIEQINFYNFDESELDTLFLYSYSKNTNFSLLIDSVEVEGLVTSDHFVAYLRHAIDTDLDYRIKLVSTGLVYTITGFEVEKKGCNTCFPYRPKSDLYKIVKSYYLNGEKQEGNKINIYK